MSHVMEICERIVREFDPERIILFGSHAYGTPREDSDVDLLVIMPFDGSGARQSVRILVRVSPEFPIDLIAKRPEDVKRQYQERNPLICEALDRGRVLYERTD